MTIEHDLAMKDLTQAVKEFIKVFGEEDFKNRYESWCQKRQIRIGWTCLPTALAKRLHAALEKVLAEIPPEVFSAIQKPESTKRKKRPASTKTKKESIATPPPATTDLEVGTW
jgi:hypothetical protein